MNIIGIKNGMVMQRGDDDTCDIWLSCDEEISQASCSNGYVPVITKIGNRYKLNGIRVGGPYTVTINNIEFTDIYVGDLWVLAGQSNMQGIGRFPFAAHNDNDKIRALYMQDYWDTANHPLHVPSLAKHKVHTEVFGASDIPDPIKAVGPGLAFARKMFKLTNVPQGIIACAHGATTLAHWNPDLKSLGGDKSLYGAMFERFIENGGNVKGMFWYQGCSDAHEEIYKHFTDNMINFVTAVRKDFEKNIPIVQVQICRCSWSEHDNRISNIAWTSVHEQQRNLYKFIDNIDTVNTVAYRLDDCIHLAGESQEIVGEDAADSMFCLLHGIGYDCLPGIKLEKIQCFPDDFNADQSRIVLTYENVHGSLQASGRAMGFDASSNDEYSDFCGIHDAYADGNRVILHTDFKFEDLPDHYLWYGFGRDSSCNIVDSRGRSLPAFGPIKLEIK